MSSNKKLTKAQKIAAKAAKKLLTCRGYKMRIHPTKTQIKQLETYASMCRYVWNWAVARQTEEYEKSKTHLNAIALSKEYTILKQESDKLWLKGLPRTCVTRLLDHLDQAWDKFFVYVAAGFKGRRVGPPKFKTFKKDLNQISISFQIDTRFADTTLNSERGTITVPCIGEIHCIYTEVLQGNPAKLTLNKKGDFWTVSIICSKIKKKELKINSKALTFTEKEKQNPLGVATIDLGVGNTATTNTGEILFNLKLSAKKERQKKRYQRIMSRKQREDMKSKGLSSKKKIPKGTKLTYSNRYKREMRKASRIDLHALFQRMDALHKFSTKLVLENHTIVIETLILWAMAQGLNRGFRRSFNTANMSKLISMLKYKCEKYGRNFVQVSKWYASSKLCSNCDYLHAKLKLSDRTWTCPSCEMKHLRDLNAAFNLWKEGCKLSGIKINKAQFEELYEHNKVKLERAELDLGSKKTVQPTEGSSGRGVSKSSRIILKKGSWKRSGTSQGARRADTAAVTSCISKQFIADKCCPVSRKSA